MTRPRIRCARAGWRFPTAWSEPRSRPGSRHELPRLAPWQASNRAGRPHRCRPSRTAHRAWRGLDGLDRGSARGRHGTGSWHIGAGDRCGRRHRRQRRDRACPTRACALRPTRPRPLSSLIRQAAKITSSTRRSTTASTPSPVLQLVSMTGRPRRTSFASSHHQIDVRPDEGRKVGLVDHQQIGPQDAEPALARNIVAAGRIDDEQPIVDELEREGRGEIVAAGLDQHDIELRKATRPGSRPPGCSGSGPRGWRYAGRRRSRRQARGPDRSGPSA